MRFLSLLTLLCALPWPALADEDELFSKKPYAFREDEKDRRFPKTRMAKLLEEPSKNAACARVSAALLMAFAEAAPYFQKKDDTFVIFTSMVNPITTERFPGNEYLLHMLRKAMLEGKAPESWLSTAKALKTRTKAPIDLSRMAYAADGAQLIDSVFFALPVVLQRWHSEVEFAPSVAQASAVDRFQDRYIDRDVAWGGLTLLDVHKEAAPPAKRVRKPKAADDEENDAPKGPFYWATLVVPTEQPAGMAPFFQSKRQEPLRIRARLAPEQYVDLKSLKVTGLHLVHGRLWSFSLGNGSPGSPPVDIEIRDALIFEDRDWSRYAGFASRDDVDACDACVNDLSPLGLKEAQGVGDKDGFSH